mgnify:CR=1 FL=1
MKFIMSGNINADLTDEPLRISAALDDGKTQELSKLLLTLPTSSMRGDLINRAVSVVGPIADLGGEEQAELLLPQVLEMIRVIKGDGPTLFEEGVKAAPARRGRSLVPPGSFGPILDEGGFPQGREDVPPRSFTPRHFPLEG